MLTALYDAAVRGAAPAPLTTAALRQLPLRAGQRTHILAIGKAAGPMAAAAADVLGDARSVVGGLVVGAEAPFSSERLLAVSGDHPLPGPRSFAAADLLALQTQRIAGDDLVLVLLSGGATSLIASPLHGLPEGDLVELFELLHRSGLDVHAMNRVRKRFTRWGAGRLAVALLPATVEVRAISDVPGDDIADIGSGPCVADTATADDVFALLRDTALLSRLPETLRRHLDACRRGAIPETPKPGHPAFRQVTTRVIGSNRLAVNAVLTHARALGIPAERGGHELSGEAARCGETIADNLLTRAGRADRCCIVWGGETTVTRDSSGVSTTTRGGRCQELALAAARRLAHGGEGAQRVSLLAAGTDGRDGPTDAAGAFADAQLVEAIMRSRIDATRALDAHQSYDALDAGGALFRRGPTGTNVMDVVIGVVT